MFWRFEIVFFFFVCLFRLFLCVCVAWISMRSLYSEYRLLRMAGFRVRIFLLKTKKISTQFLLVRRNYYSYYIFPITLRILLLAFSANMNWKYYIETNARFAVKNIGRQYFLRNISSMYISLTFTYVLDIAATYG